MFFSLSFKKGSNANLTNLNLKSGEPAFAEDTGRFFIGDKNGNKIEFAKVTDLENNQAFQTQIDGLKDLLGIIPIDGGTFFETNKEFSLDGGTY